MMRKEHNINDGFCSLNSFVKKRYYFMYCSTYKHWNSIAEKFEPHQGSCGPRLHSYLYKGWVLREKGYFPRAFVFPTCSPTVKSFSHPLPSSVGLLLVTGLGWRDEGGLVSFLPGLTVPGRIQLPTALSQLALIAKGLQQRS